MLTPEEKRERQRRYKAKHMAKPDWRERRRASERKYQAKPEVRTWRRAYSKARQSSPRVQSWTAIYNLTVKFGITAEEARRLLAVENCDVCGVRLGKYKGRNRRQVDHCHAGGHIRGVLCFDCNLALGLVRDDPSRLMALAAYLERHAAELLPIAVGG